jgi:signal transduction histidine kinase
VYRRHEDLQLLQRTRELEAARRICQALFQQIEVDELVERTIRMALEVIGAEAGSILMADPETRQLVFRYVIGGKADALHGMGIPWDKGIAGAVFHSGEPVVSSDVTQNDRHFSEIDTRTGYQTRDMIVLPLKRWGGEPIGVLEVLNKREGRLDSSDVGILTIISALSAETIEQARLFEEAKLAEVVRILGDIGHDVKNLLQPVVTATGLLQSEIDDLYAGLPAAELRKAQASHDLCNEVIGMLRESSQRIQDRMKQIADCVKGLSAPPKFSPCQLGDVVNSVVRTLRVLAQERGVSFRAEGLESLPPIMGDESRLFNAFYNLINNAIPEVQAGGSITILGYGKPEAGVVFLEVTDTGRGMPPEVCQNLFTARTTSRKAGGTGLGTKIVKDAVLTHGGQITVKSEVGVGTTFSICLPINPHSASVLRATQ